MGIIGVFNKKHKCDESPIINVVKGYETSLIALSLPLSMVIMSAISFALPTIPVLFFIAIYSLIYFITLASTVLDVVLVISKDMSYALATPLSLSILMNPFLASIAPGLESVIGMILLSSNIMYAFIVALIGFLVKMRQGANDSLLKLNFALLACLILYSLILFVFNPVGITSFMSTLRNLISPFLFLILGLTLANRCKVSNACLWVIFYGLTVSLFGLYEIFANPSFWKEANIAELWNMKGIGVSAHTGMPSNFYSSEQIAGSSLRRMSSLFADPVNLGTFLFAFLTIAWYRRKWVLVILSIVCCALTVSKGALLGILVFSLAYFWVRFGKSFYTRAAFCIVITIATIFLLYSMLFTTGSVAAHMSGFIGGIKSMIGNPFGYGCGNVGVLASLTNDNHIQGLEESGFGVIAGEVGVVGIAAYVAMIISLILLISRVRHRSAKILMLALLGTIVLNILFNEVALSPNSSGLYFSIIGLFAGQAGGNQRSSDSSNVFFSDDQSTYHFDYLHIKEVTINAVKRFLRE